MNKLLLLLTVSFLAGCSTAGPYVTSISSDGNCNLIVEKSSTKYNSISGTVSNEGGTTSTIKVCN